MLFFAIRIVLYPKVRQEISSRQIIGLLLYINYNLSLVYRGIRYTEKRNLYLTFFDCPQNAILLSLPPKKHRLVYLHTNVYRTIKPQLFFPLNDVFKSKICSILIKESYVFLNSHDNNIHQDAMFSCVTLPFIISLVRTRIKQLLLHLLRFFVSVL